MRRQAILALAMQKNHPSSEQGLAASGMIEMDAPVTRREIRLVYAGFMVVMALAALDQSIVSTALPRIVSDLGGVAYLSWIVTAYVLASTSVIPLYGKLSDQYGRKPLIYSAVAIFLIGSVLCAFATSMMQLLIFRVIQGLGAGGLVPLSQIIIGDLVPPRERGRYQGNIGMVYAAAIMGGPILGGIIADALSWHWIFLINLPIGLAAFVMIALTLRRRHVPRRRSIDFLGAALLAGATSGLLLMLSLGGRVWPWLSLESLGMMIGTIVLIGLFIWRERHAEEPVMPLLLFRNKVFVLAILVTALTFMCTQGAGVYYPLFFQIVYGVKMSNSGWLSAPMMIGTVISARVNGQIVVRTGRYKKTMVGGLLMGFFGYIFLVAASSTAQPIYLIEICLLIIGLAFGTVTPNMVVAVQNAVDIEHMGAATAATTFFRALGGVTGVAACGAILTASLTDQFTSNTMPIKLDGATLLKGGIVQVMALPPEANLVAVEIYRQAIASVFALGIFCSLLAFGLTLLLPELPLRTRVGPSEEPKPSQPHQAQDRIM
jgi:EmrB/QacA subfamily drug resistance transporter